MIWLLGSGEATRLGLRGSRAWPNSSGWGQPEARPSGTVPSYVTVLGMITGKDRHNGSSRREPTDAGHGARGAERSCLIVYVSRTWRFSRDCEQMRHNMATAYRIVSAQRVARLEVTHEIVTAPERQCSSIPTTQRNTR